MQLGTEAVGIFALAAICIGIVVALCSKFGSSRDGAGKHSLLPASDDEASILGKPKRGASKHDGDAIVEAVDSDDWEELQIQGAARQKAQIARNADKLPPNALRIDDHFGNMSNRSDRSDANDVRLFGRKVESRKVQLTKALPLTCQPAFMGFDSTRSKSVTPTGVLTFGGTGGS